jgi:hypothetical protein
MAEPNPAQQVFVIADDPIEAGMLALDLVHAGLAAQAVRDGSMLASQLRDAARIGQPALVSAFRDLSQTFDLFGQLQEQHVPGRFIAVVLRSQRDAAERQARENQWAGVAVRPVNAEEIVALAGTGSAVGRPPSGATSRDGDLTTMRLLDVLAGMVDRVPRAGGGKNVMLELTSHGRIGRVAIVDGELVHAECDGESGRHVLERLACWRDGEWHIEPHTWGGTSTLTGSSIGLLAVAQEYNRRVEEARQNLPYTDCRCTVRWERVRPLPVVAEALFRRIAAGVVLADAIPGEGDDELEAYAALENRIKRGAVVPQIETTTSVPSSDTMEAAAALTPHAIRAESLASSMRTGVLLPDTAEQAPQHAHPATHLYRVDDSQPRRDHGNPRTSDIPPALPTADTPPALPRPMSGMIASAAARMPSGVLRTNSAAALDTSRYNSVENAARRGAVTGWFGVAMAESDEATAEADAPLRAPARRGDSQQLAAFRATPRAGTETNAPLNARPYAWLPDADADMRAAAIENEEENHPDGKLNAKPPTVRWPWMLAGLAALGAVVFALTWPGHTTHNNGRRGRGQDYRRAVNLIEAGQYDDAIKRLQAVIQAPSFEPEALLSLGVLEIEARQFNSGRTHLQAYLALPAARDADRAQKLYDFVFAPDAPTPTAGPANHPTPSGG